jgi:hypothetical protein
VGQGAHRKGRGRSQNALPTGLRRCFAPKAKR